MVNERWLRTNIHPLLWVLLKRPSDIFLVKDELSRVEELFSGVVNLVNYRGLGIDEDGARGRHASRIQF